MHRFVNHFTAERGIKSYYDNSPLPPPLKKENLFPRSQSTALSPIVQCQKRALFPFTKIHFGFGRITASYAFLTVLIL